jgi:hypothetical protein
MGSENVCQGADPSLRASMTGQKSPSKKRIFTFALPAPLALGTIRAYLDWWRVCSVCDRHISSGP